MDKIDKILENLKPSRSVFPVTLSDKGTSISIQCSRYDKPTSDGSYLSELVRKSFHQNLTKGLYEIKKDEIKRDMIAGLCSDTLTAISKIQKSKAGKLYRFFRFNFKYSQNIDLVVETLNFVNDKKYYDTADNTHKHHLKCLEIFNYIYNKYK
jgi:hypothetical protein